VHFDLVDFERHHPAITPRRIPTTASTHVFLEAPTEAEAADLVRITETLRPVAR
jgi:hypothetical protein